MAERIARSVARDAGIADSRLVIDSMGISSEERGNPIDPRAARVLEERGYDADGHAARQVDQETVRSANLLVVAESFHADRLFELGAREDAVRLMTDFDPESPDGATLPDPWYGGSEDFDSTLAVLERAMPRLIEEVAQQCSPGRAS